MMKHKKLEINIKEYLMMIYLNVEIIKYEQVERNQIKLEIKKIFSYISCN